jgi:fatty-acyl-CoA synthase
MNIAFTSGTTGFPKGGMSMHITNLCAFGHATARLSITENSVLIYQVPVFTNFGCWLTCAGVLEGCTLVLCGEPHFDPAQTLDLIEKEKVTHMVGAPTHYIDLSEHPDVDKYDLSSLEVAFLGGSDLAPEQNRRLSEKFGKYGVMSYGLSECGGFGTTTLSTDPPDLIYGMIGVPLPSVRVKIVNPETGKRIIGEPGEIYLHDVYPGSCVGKGYYNMPDATRAAITDDGWFKTGDLAMELENGYFVWKGRLKHAMRVGSMNVYPVEMENALMTHPKVVEAVVIGVPDKRLGEVPMAWVCTRGEMTSEELMEFARANLAAFKLPRYVKFYKPGELPVTGSGKYEKYKLLKMAIKELGLC